MMLMLDEDKLTRSKDKRTCLLVHRKVSEQHRAPGVIIYLEISGIIIYLQICLLYHKLFTLSLSSSQSSPALSYFALMVSRIE